MNVRIIDTSVLVNILNVPYMNDKHEEIMGEFKKIVQNKETLILPLATIIETGNHIAHITDGSVRRTIAKRMSTYLERTANGEAPWEYYCRELDKDDLYKLSQDFSKYAVHGTGFGDLSIIRAYEKYKKETPAIGRIMIWTLDSHLSGYEEEMNLPIRRRNK